MVTRQGAAVARTGEDGRQLGWRSWGAFRLPCLLEWAAALADWGDAVEAFGKMLSLLKAE